MSTEAKQDGILPGVRSAIVEAAKRDLEYAKQYLDKFENWSDYVLACHYHACVTALCVTEDDKTNREAAAEFEEVARWMKSGDALLIQNWNCLDEKHRKIIAARQRVCAEAMFNQAVLLGNNLQASDQAIGRLEELINYLQVIKDQSSNSMSFNGIRIAAEFAKLELYGRQRDRLSFNEIAGVQSSANQLKEEISQRRDVLSEALMQDERDALKEKTEGSKPSKWRSVFRSAASDRQDVSKHAKKIDERIVTARKDIALLDLLKERIDTLLGKTN